MQSANESTMHVEPIVSQMHDVFFQFLARYFDAYWEREGMDPSLKGEWFENPGAEYRQAMRRLIDQDDDETVDNAESLHAESMPIKRTMCVAWPHFAEYAPAEADILQRDFPRFRLPLSRALFYVMHDILGVDMKDAHALSYDVAFYRVPQTFSVRELRAGCNGLLCTLNATVTRMTQVRPELVQTCFTCRSCGATSDPILQNYTYTMPIKCAQEGCENTEMWTVLHNRHTVISDWQKIKAQEDSEALLPGSTPRSVDVIVRGDFVERAFPGDKLSFTGFISVVPEVGKLFGQQERRELQRQVDAGSGREQDGGGFSGAVTGGDGVEGLRKLGSRVLAYKLCFIAVSASDRDGALKVHDSTPARHAPLSGVPERSLRTAQESLVAQIVNTPNFFDALISCVAPNIFGYKLIKLGILLQIIGGVHKVTLDGTALRGDINLCLIGDPAVAKSQFLKWTSRTAPRGVYTCGKTSTAAGLTASVAKDSDTGEFTIEAGALMLADNGLCCIDDFDKMEQTDMVAIHEAMEQQTISIAKAGIKATLRARASVLAAANPIGGVYNISKPLHQNVMMTQPVMSRFDLIFILADTSTSADRALAERITALHKDGELPVHLSNGETITHDDFMSYLEYARGVKPRLSEEACEMLAAAYRDLRTEKTRSVTHKMFRYTTRQLESMIRLSEAVARLHLDDEVRPAHVQMVLTLMKASMSYTDISDDFTRPQIRRRNSETNAVS